MEEIKKFFPNLIVPFQKSNECKWKKFSNEELQKLSENSSSKEDFFKRIGYKTRKGYSYHRPQLAILEEYPDFIFPRRVGSKGEEKLRKIFTNMNLDFEEQFSFLDLLSIKNDKLLFDFKINIANKIILIEYQGEQHYQAINFFGGEERFLYQKENDNRKRVYCKNNNIPLIEIPYWDFEKLDENYIKEKINECFN